MRCRDESWAQEEDSEVDDAGSLVAARLLVGGALAILRAAGHLLYLQ